MPDTSSSPLRKRGRSLGVALVALLCATLAFAGRGSKSTCGPGRFLVEDGPPLLPAGHVVKFDAIAVDAGGAISIDSGCRSVRGRVKPTKRGVGIKARWPAGACVGVTGKTKLGAHVAPGCETLTGTLKGKGLRRPFSAKRSQCGDGIVDVGGGETCDGVLLAGDPQSSALAALFDLAPQPALPGDIVSGLLLTRLDVVIAAQATVGEVNEAFAAVDGSIVAMKTGIPAVTLSVPRQSGSDGLRALADRLAAKPGIRLAQLARDVALDGGPPPPPPNDDTSLGHLRAARFPAAWNAKHLAEQHCTDKVAVLVADKFHRPADALYAEFATQVPGVTDLGTGTVPADDVHGFHGYDVTTTLAARLDDTVPTGAIPLPECLDLRALQISGLSPFEIAIAIDDAIPASGKMVANASFGFDSCDGPCLPTTMNVPRAVDRAAWAALQRALLQPVEDRLLVTASAGNETGEQVGLLYPGTALAAFNSALTIAAKSDSMMSFVTDTSLWDPTSNCPPEPCFPSLSATPDERATLDALLVDFGQTSSPPAANVIVVGSSDAVRNDPSASSDPVADVYAVGEGIPTLLGIPEKGTSFSAPQVAGLAAYLWLLSPDLRSRPVADTIAAIEANARVSPFRLIDAYATVLSLDPAVQPSATDTKVRLAVVDTDDDGDFDEVDLQRFHDALRPGGLPIEPSTPDYSRFDLNGDGFTGGTRTARFDLDPTGSTRFGAPMLTQVTTEVGGELRTYDETAVSDADVLCFYAYDDLLYAGDPVARDALLFDLCSVDLTLAGSIVVRTDVDATRNCNPDCTTEQGFEQESWTVRLTAQPDGTFAATGTVTQSLHDVTTFPGTHGETCTFTWDESGTGPVLSYSGRVTDPAGILDGVATVTRTQQSSACNGNPASTDMEVLDRSFFVGSDVVTPVLDGGGLVGLSWDFRFDDGAGTIDTVSGHADLVR